MARRPRPDQIDRLIAARIRTRRVELGINQTELAEMIGVTYQQQFKYEHAVNRVSAGRLAIICKALGLDPRELLAINGEELPQPRRSSRGALELARAASELPAHIRVALLRFVRALGQRV